MLAVNLRFASPIGHCPTIIALGLMYSPGTLCIVSSSVLTQECFRIWVFLVQGPNSFSLAEKEHWSWQWICCVVSYVQASVCSQCSCMPTITQRKEYSSLNSELKEALYIFNNFFFVLSHASSQQFLCDWSQMFLKAVFDHFFVHVSSSFYYHWCVLSILARFLMETDILLISVLLSCWLVKLSGSSFCCKIVHSS